MHRLEDEGAFHEEDRRNAAIARGSSSEAQLAKRISDETGEDIFRVAFNMAKQKAESITADSSVEDRVDAFVLVDLRFSNLT